MILLLVLHFGLTAAVGLLGCDFTSNDGTSITDYCPVTCDNCPSDCADDDTAAGVAGFGGCSAAVGLLGCDLYLLMEHL